MTRARAKAAPDLDRCVNVLDFEPLARERMGSSHYDYYAGGAEDERTLAANRDAFSQVFLRPRVLVDVSRIETSTRVLGTEVSMPILVAPTAFHRLAHPDGELATARGTGASRTLMVVSTIATYPLEEIASAATGPLWFQLYVYKDRGLARNLIQRAEKAGYRALCLTVDTPHLGCRERDRRNKFTLPEGVLLRNFENAGIDASELGDSFHSYVHRQLDCSLTWDAVEWLKGETKLPLILKGIIRPEDARLAVERGVEGILVSNHGGRQLDGTEATLRALPRVAEAVAGRAEVFMDGGVRRGTDVVKALALGARAVLVGRPSLWGLAAAGEEGVTRVLEMLRQELALSMALCGCPDLG
ncbi:MAG TPA: alpha-hydroxy acid oxidase, partial [Candidatus Polarisedimenticolia bacterium]|nr:alpha-hydroxy acid oxidase [Candidatus Polarisedimenticolia bacterium]